MSTTKLKSASESDNPQDQNVDHEIRHLKLENNRYKKENKDLKDQNMSLAIALLELDKTNTVLEKQLQRAQQENIHLTENYFRTSILQLIFILISNITIAIGIAYLSTNGGVILIIVGICAYAASFLPAFLDLRKYWKARKHNP